MKALDVSKKGIHIERGEEQGVARAIKTRV